MNIGKKIRLFVLFLTLYMLTMGGHIYSPDEELIFRTTRAIVENRSLSIEPLLGFGTRTGANGKEYAQYGIGQPLAAVPLYVIGKVSLSISEGNFLISLFTDTVQYHPKTCADYVVRLFISLFNQIITAFTVVLVGVFGWYLTGDRKAALLSAILYGAGTLALPHSRTFFTEPFAAFLVGLTLMLLFKGSNLGKLRYFIVSGMCFGYALLTRLDSILFFPGLVLYVALENARFIPDKKKISTWVLIQFRRPGLPRWLSFLSPIFFFCVILIGLNYLRFGGALSTGYEDQPEGVAFSTPILAGLYGFLFSVGKGLFFFSPPLVLFLFSLKRLWHGYRNLAIGMLVMILTFLLVQSTWQNWAGGWCWGPRHIFQIHLLLAIPIALLLSSPLRAVTRISYLVLLIIGFMIQVYGSSQSFIDFYIDFYRTPVQQPNAYALYSEDEVNLLSHYYALTLVPSNESSEKPIDFRYLIAPINDSIYVMQNSQWYGYLAMWKYGKTDFFWLKMLRTL